MGYGLQLTKYKKVLREDEKGDLKELDFEDAFSYIFSDNIESIEGWTVRDLFEYIKPLGGMFGELAWCDFDAFYSDMNKESPKDEFSGGIEFIEIGWIAEIYEKGGHLTEGLDVVGINDSYTDEEIENASEDEEKHRRYGLDFTSVSEIADIPIRLNEEYKVVNWEDKRNIIFETKKQFTLLDVIWAILWEISFYGSPEDKDKKKKELFGIVAEIKSGKVKTIPWEEVKSDLLKKKDEEN